MPHCITSLLVHLALILLIIADLKQSETRSISTESGVKQDYQFQMEQEPILKQQLRERRAIYRFPEYADYGRNREKKPRPGKNGYPHPSYGVLSYALG